jgi:hypothetical protein
MKGECAKCGSGEIDYFDNENTGECIGYKYECEKCGFNGTEWYNLLYNCDTNSDGTEIFEGKKDRASTTTNDIHKLTGF